MATTAKKETEKPKKGSKSGVIIGTIVLVSLLTAGGVVYAIKRKQQQEDEPENPTEQSPSTNTSSSSSSSSIATKRRITKPTASATLPVTTVPANATMNAATAAKVAEQIRRATYITVKDDYGNNWPILVNSLAKIKNVKDYELVNAEYLKIGFVSKTVVTHLLSTYGQFNAYRQVLVKEFLRIGLKQSPDGKWSLNGFGNLGNSGRGVITTAPAIVLHEKSNSQRLFRGGSVLGNEVARTKGISKIITKSREVIYAPSQSLAYL